MYVRLYNDFMIESSDVRKWWPVGPKTTVFSSDKIFNFCVVLNICLFKGVLTPEKSYRFFHFI